MAKTVKTSPKKVSKGKVRSSPKTTKAKAIKKSSSPTKKSSSSSSSKKQKWAAPYEKKIRMFKQMPDYFQLNAKYSKL